MLFLLCVLLLPAAAGAQLTVSGTVTDHQTGETLIGATVYDALSGRGTTTDVNGRYSLTVKGKEARVRVSFVGYETVHDTVRAGEGRNRNYALKPSIRLQEVVVTAQRVQGRESSQMSAIEIPVEQIKAVPVLFGEACETWEAR